MSRPVSPVARSRAGGRPRWQMTTRPATALVLGVAGLAFAVVQVALFSTPPTWFQLAVAVFWGVVGAAYLASAGAQAWRVRSERAARGTAPATEASRVPGSDPRSSSPDLVPVRPARARRAPATAVGRRERAAAGLDDHDDLDDLDPDGRDPAEPDADRDARRDPVDDEPLTLRQRRLPVAGPVPARGGPGPPRAPDVRPGPATARSVPLAVTGPHGPGRPGGSRPAGGPRTPPASPTRSAPPTPAGPPTRSVPPVPSAPPPRGGGPPAPRGGAPVPPPGVRRWDGPAGRHAPPSPPRRAAHAAPTSPGGTVGPPADPSAVRLGRHHAGAPPSGSAVPGPTGSEGAGSGRESAADAPAAPGPESWRAPYGSWSEGPGSHRSAGRPDSPREGTGPAVPPTSATAPAPRSDLRSHLSFGASRP